MTVSTDAILFYGYCCDEETRQPWTIGCEDDRDHDDEDWEDRYARVRGVIAPSASFPERIDEYGRAPKDYTPAEQGYCRNVWHAHRQHSHTYHRPRQQLCSARTPSCSSYTGAAGAKPAGAV